MKGGVVAIVAILAVVAMALQQGEAVSCGEVDAALLPCVKFLTGNDQSPPDACCAGVRKVKALAVTPADKRAACGCVKNAANSYSNLNDAAAKDLPKDCGVSLDIPVSRTVDCSKIE